MINERPPVQFVLQSSIKESRRDFFHAAGAVIAGVMVAPSLLGCASGRTAWSKRDPFSLGVASGEPRADGFVIWTRLAPEPLSPDVNTPGGMSGGAVRLAYEIATDEDMRNIVQRGECTANPVYAYSVHVHITDLLSGRPYWYRFMSGDATSRVGRAITAATVDDKLARLRIGFISCANYEHGYFSAYRHLADESPDAVLFLGDYIYEYVDKRPRTVRKHSDAVEANSLPTYRNRYAQYRLDPDLQRLHAQCAALITWDDHEVQNDYADKYSQTFDDPEIFLKRRAAAYQAFYEHMPISPIRSRPAGSSLRLYDRFQFGTLVEISMLDGRQYRSPQSCYSQPKKGGAHLESNLSCPERLAEARTMLGIQQEKWLFDGLAKSNARWNVMAQDVLMAGLRQKQGDNEYAYWTDDWNGYPASRTRLLQHLHDVKVKNPVVLAGDIHSFWTNDLKLDFDNPQSKTVATEFVGTSVTAHGGSHETFAKLLPDNPHIKFFESRVRGYSTLDITPDKITTAYRAVSNAQDPNATVSTLKTFVVTDGMPGAIEDS